ncbi:hypothetical protein O9H85_18175 [Paenibacillus filicis]|uniref:Uncharacterized protein n=1 Tax=Paenibacillus gyeongsangnamensis TaxID=3388067 RepID=A0ABT4QBX7_9BACL|nr:hypothetical protein [Paenibacillus filicis]MCZ8514318.1 hypothetical protein [Paenibacillus filicis]
MNLQLIETLSNIAAFMTAVAMITLIVLHVLPTRYNPILDAVSDMASVPTVAGFGCKSLRVAWLVYSSRYP